MSDALKIWGTEYTNAKGFKAKDPTGQTTFTYLRPQGSKSITTNGNNIDVSEFATVNVSVPGGTGGNDFVITVSKNAQTGYWEPDCTWADVADAYTAGKNITVNTDDVDNVQADGALRVMSGQLNDFHYVVNELFDAGQGEDWAVLQGVYQLDSNGLVRNDIFTYYDTYPANSAASDLASGKIAYGQNGRIVGTYVPPSGTAGTPVATKGTVSNHSVSITPSVTNTTGYIEGSTKTGTAVTVTASELVSGSETKTTNGTYDVTNLASLVVSIPIVTYYTGSSAPSSSLGSNGDIYLQTS